MLVLTRKVGEAVVVGDNEINLIILGVNGNQVRLGFRASKDISIHRDEIYNRIQLEKHQNKSKNELSIDESIIDQLETRFKKPFNKEITH